MDFELDPGQRQWLQEVRAFLREHVTPALVAELAEHDLEKRDGELAAFRRKIGDKGWFGLNWPTEYGGLGLGPIHQHLLVSEFERWGVPGPDLTVTSVAPMIMRHGTEQNKAEFLPPIARGEMVCAVGYSEPDAGTDLASLRTRAVLDGDEWVINGSKIWNSGAQRSTHEWLCVRTNPDVPKHKGISVIIVPIDAPGISIRPLMAWSGYRTNETFFDNVRVPATNLIGEVDKGWRYITGALDLERGALTNAGDLRRAVDDLLALAREPRRDGVVPVHDAGVRRRLAELDADVEVATLMGFEAASLLEDGTIPSVEVSTEKIFTSELRQRIAEAALDLLGPDGLLGHNTAAAPLAGSFERLYRAAPLLRFGAGTNEVLRDVIAQRGHRMPSYGR
ncbi:alkylation response protein AidB-like acyl-CoA dehydrogenase [Nocardioides massiliensis]|uniref:Alkylation response protein AidB-like acyl-CoA dehydrogenase n=3 Tax=Nocardioides massiliensis TaxID=1325935 RepID=A0ABT9NVV1_9ACTN|nr:acyl-CoA dehydrogenase family protein [Nocardioides massiliensis]MDP9823955.1 alkylation response protein AidB-like acyl-CoA dehydrogenase [Nocardioides massiliensis]